MCKQFQLYFRCNENEWSEQTKPKFNTAVSGRNSIQAHAVEHLIVYGWGLFGILYRTKAYYLYSYIAYINRPYQLLFWVLRLVINRHLNRP